MDNVLKVCHFNNTPSSETFRVNILAVIVTMEHNPDPQFSKAHLTNMNLNNIKMIQAIGLQIIASRSPLMALPPYQTSRNSTKRLRSY
jgi:hypothetical protein